MSVGNQNTRITKPFDSEHLEELASQSVRVFSEPGEPQPEAPLAASSARTPRSVESDPRPTCKIHKNELLGLLDMSDRMASTPPPDPTPVEPRMAHARLVPAGSTGDVVVIIDDDEDHKTQRMQATHFRAVVEGGLPITPALLESIDWYAEADAAAEQARMAPRAPEAFLDELGRARPEDGTAKPASRSPGSCGTAPEMARSPEERPSTPPLERVTGPQLPPARSHAVLRLLMSMIVLAIVGFVIGFVIAT